jgi:hypothetical protein
MRFIKNILFRTGTAGVILFMLSLSTLFSSCTGGSASAFHSSLAYVNASGPQTTGAEFRQDGSYVIRCTASEDNAGGLSFSATKIKTAKITSLIFINLDQVRQSGANAVITAVVPVDGSEGECSLVKANYRMVSLESAQKAVNDYGIPYSDWLSGATDASQKFPCCQ